ncbi:alpha/beta fold hydrolase [Elongatibacter sediminis]|uniref:Alpha/beta fold hydrolase n=1 Tax=Elongatibacter sediminis TaxID=3119006 RepID=A0AAW9REH7_9GAMM
MSQPWSPPPDLYPFDSHWLQRPAGRMHYLDEGPADAPPVLMLHGNPTWSFYYRKLVLGLRGTHRCIVPDHLGCGLSDKPPASAYDYRLASRIDDLDTLIRHVAPDRPLTLVVHDWGGMIGFAWAVRNPHRIARLVILNTAAFPLPEDKPMPWALSLVRNTRLGAWLVLRMNAFAGSAARVAFKKPVDPRVRSAYVGPYDTPANRIATLRFVQDIPLAESDPGFDILTETAEHLGQFADRPCLIAWGGRDFVFDRSFLRRWREIYPHARLESLDDCGHYVLEDGGEGLVRTLCDFIDVKDDSNHGHNGE